MRLLIVEDEESLASSLQRGLEAEGYVVEVAHDGPDGLWRATEFDYDAVVLDVMLPGLNGFAVAQRLRDAGRLVPILMLTAKSGDLDEAEALDVGADDFLSKPFSYPVLLSHLRALIRRTAGRVSNVLRAGDLVLDPLAHRCWRGEEEIALSERELRLLEYLLHRRGEVVTKTELLRHAWANDEATLNAVEVYVGYVRRKIDVPFGRNAIETVRGRGYRLAPDGG